MVYSGIQYLVIMWYPRRGRHRPVREADELLRLRRLRAALFGDSGRRLPRGRRYIILYKIQSTYSMILH